MEHWPPSSLLDRVLFENFWPALVLFGALGLILGYRALRTRNRRLGIAAGLMALVAVIVVPLTMLVQTTREALIERTQQLVGVAVPPIDFPGLDAMLEENVELTVRGDSDAVTENRRQLMDLAQRAQSKFEVTDPSIGRVDARRIDATHGESFLRLHTTLAIREGGFNGYWAVPTEWLIAWHRGDDNTWRITRIDFRSVAGQPADRGQLP